MAKSIPSTLGAVFLGISLAGIFTGLVCAQVPMYFRRCRRDKVHIKLMVFAVWLLDVFHTAMLITSGWIWLIENFGNPDTDYIPPTIPAAVATTVLTTAIVQGFFITRAHQLSGNSLVTAPLVALVLVRVGFGCGTCVKMLIYGKLSVFLEKVPWMFTLGLATSSILDILLTCILLHYLRHLKTGFINLDHIIDRLSLYTLQSGLLTTIFVVVALAFWVVMHDNLVFLALYFMINKLYATSFLTTLIARDGIRDRLWIPQEIPPSVLTSPDPFRRQSTPLTAELPIQFDPPKAMTTMPDSFECVMGDIGMTPLSGTFQFGRFSLDAKNIPELEHDRKVSLNTVA